MPKLANGFLCFGPSFFVSAAFILSMYAQWRCNYVNTGSDAEVNSENGLRFVEKIGPTCYTAIGGVAYKYPEGTIGLPEANPVGPHDDDGDDSLLYHRNMAC